MLKRFGHRSWMLICNRCDRTPPPQAGTMTKKEIEQFLKKHPHWRCYKGDFHLCGRCDSKPTQDEEKEATEAIKKGW